MRSPPASRKTETRSFGCSSTFVFNQDRIQVPDPPKSQLQLFAVGMSLILTADLNRDDSYQNLFSRHESGACHGLLIASAPSHIVAQVINQIPHVNSRATKASLAVLSSQGKDSASHSKPYINKHSVLCLPS